MSIGSEETLGAQVYHLQYGPSHCRPNLTVRFTVQPPRPQFPNDRLQEVIHQLAPSGFPGRREALRIYPHKIPVTVAHPFEFHEILNTPTLA